MSVDTKVACGVEAIAYARTAAGMDADGGTLGTEQVRRDVEYHSAVVYAGLGKDDQRGC